jgi:MYXO-CTERM domain-containing protein
MTAKVTGLQNGSAYQFVVVAIDPFGNPTPSATFTAAPTGPTETHKHSGGCAVGHSESPSTALPLLLALLALAAARLRRV